MDISSLFTRNYWIETTGSEFNFGFLSALALIAAVAFLLLLVLISLVWVLRCRRVSEITVPQKDGEVVISRDALEQAVVEALARSSVFTLHKLKIERCSKSYGLSLYCNMSSSGNMEKVIPESKQVVLETLKNNFSIGNIKNLRIIIEKLNKVYMPEKSSAPAVAKPESDPDEANSDISVQ